MTPCRTVDSETGVPLREPYGRTASGEAVWRWITIAFAAYWILFITGSYTGRPELNDVGAVFVLAAMGWAAMERLWVRIDAISAACLIAAILPLLTMLATHAERYPGAIVKHVSLCVVMALARLLRLPVASESRMRWLLAFQILVILILSITKDKGGVWDGGSRHSGLFANPNNLALIPFLLLFFINRKRDKLAIQLIAHAVVIGVLAWSGTSGAVLAYAIGLAVHFQAEIPSLWRVPAILFVSFGALLAAVLLFGGGSILPETRLTNQIVVMRRELSTVLGGGEVAYYEQERVLGPGAASGIWRLVHWRRTLTTYLNGSPGELLVGFGIGSSPAYMGKLPHNEYLRALFEQGIIGLALFLFIWTRIIRTAPRSVRYCGLIVAIYSFSENNLDNFPFMALFVLCLSAVETHPPAKAPTTFLNTFSHATAC